MRYCSHSKFMVIPLSPHLLFHIRQKTLQLFKAFIFYSRFCVTKEQVKLMITHPTDKIIGKVFVYEFMNVLLDGITRRSSQLADFLVALTLCIKTKYLSYPAHEYCFISHLRVGLSTQLLHLIAI